MTEYVRRICFTGDGNRVGADNLYKEFMVRLWIFDSTKEGGAATAPEIIPDIIADKVQFVSTHDLRAWALKIVTSNPLITAVEITNNRGDGVAMGRGESL